MSTGGHFITHRAVTGRYLTELLKPLMICPRQNSQNERSQNQSSPIRYFNTLRDSSANSGTQTHSRHLRSLHEIDSFSFTLLRALIEALYEI